MTNVNRRQAIGISAAAAISVCPAVSVADQLAGAAALSSFEEGIWYSLTHTYETATLQMLVKRQCDGLIYSNAFIWGPHSKVTLVQRILNRENLHAPIVDGAGKLLESTLEPISVDAETV